MVEQRIEMLLKENEMLKEKLRIANEMNETAFLTVLRLEKELMAYQHFTKAERLKKI